MELSVVERLIALVEASRVAELDYAEGGARVRIVRAGAAPAPPVASPGASPAASPTAPPSAPADHIVAAGIPGTFFRAPAPGQPPFVEVGDSVAEGQTLGMLEAMKTFNPVEADRAGRIARILAADGTSVAPGAPLFAVAGEG